MPRRRTALIAIAVLTALLCAVPARSLASTTEVSMLMDDDQLIYVSQQHMAQTLERIHSLGVDVVKASMVWQLVAPNPYSKHRPAFDATDPAAYPPGAWSRYDALVEIAQRLGMQVSFLLIGPAPAWAIPEHLIQGEGPSLGYAPKTAEFRQFAEAVGRRYSGAYVPPGADTGQPIPRVNYWGVWNEPNERSWLNPWYQPLPHHRKVLIQPKLYRGLLDAAWSGLAASDHASDQVMIGETANAGVIDPIPFVRALYCVGANLRPLRGSSASQMGCPPSGNPAQFLSQHPGLFEMAGYAHHPYAFDVPPDRPYPVRSFITIRSLPSFERMLVRIFAAYDVRPPAGVPIYLTEWGYKSNPPNPYVETSEAEQAAWLNEAEYMTWRYPFVQALAQFLLVDSAPKQGEQPGTPLYWSTFQTGLETMDGAPKPAFFAYRIPVWLPVARHGPSVAIWAQLRPADHTTTQSAYIQFEPSGSSGWSQLAQAQTNSPEGFLLDYVAIPSPGLVRIAWLDPSGNSLYSRTVPVS